MTSAGTAQDAAPAGESTPAAGSPPPRAAPRAVLPHPVLALMSALVAAAILVGALVVHLRPGMPVLGLATAVLLLAFAVTEAFPMHLELGKQSQSVTLSEFTLVIGLFLLPVGTLALTRLVGGSLVLLLVLRQPGVKLVFNLCLWCLDVVAAGAVFHRLDGSLHDGLTHLVVPAVAAVFTAAVVDSVAVSAAVSLTSRELNLRRAREFLVASALSAAGTALLTVIAASALSLSLWLAAPIAVLLAMATAAFSAWGRLRQQHIEMTQLYSFTAQLARAGSSQHVVHTLLEQVGRLMRADRSRLLVLSGDNQTLHSYGLEAGVVDEQLLSVDELHDELLQAMHGTLAVTAASTTRDPLLQDLLRRLSLRDGVWAPLSGDSDLRGLLLVGNRSGDVATFGGSDDLLLHTLATQAGAALAAGRLLERLDIESRHDPLTGLANRTEFHRLVELAMRDEGVAQNAVLLMDLDRFKEVNDTLGHHHGDLLLREIANRLRGCLRPGDVLARLGGDEFALLLHRVTPSSAVVIGRRVMATLAEAMTLQGVAMEVSASCGVVLAPDHGRDAETLLQRADVAMYMAKRDLTSIQIYRAELDDSSPRRLALAGSLRLGLEGEQLSLRFQPQVSTRDGRVVAVEALVRWQHPEFGEVSPVDFIDVAEQTGQIRDLTHWVLRRALLECAGWRADGHDIGVSVNISVRNLLDPDLPQVVAESLLSNHLDADVLTLEITETHLMADPERTGAVLQSLSRLGCRLSVDDFGTGYSSLAYLKSMPVREVKVDRSFVRDVANSVDDAAIVEAVIQLGHTLGLEVVAEGVEDLAAAVRLTELGCDLLQGWHIAYPMTREGLDEWLLDHRRRSTKGRILHLEPPAATDLPGPRHPQPTCGA